MNVLSRLDTDVQKSYGLIFLFKYIKEEDTRLTLTPQDCPELFYAKQVIQNACATQAILSAILNAQGIDIGSTLEEFKQFTLELDPETKGYAIGNSDVIRQAHNAFAPQLSFESENQSKSRMAKDEAYHFIAYVPFQGIIYELDGLKAGPIILGATASDEEWLSVAKPAIEERIARYSSSETSFALLNICPKKSLLLDEEIASKSAELANLEEALRGGADTETMTLRDDLANQLAQLRNQRAEEDYKLQRQREENNRRRHDYTPFILTLLRHLSTQDKLNSIIENGRKRAADAAARKMCRK